MKTYCETKRFMPIISLTENTCRKNVPEEICDKSNDDALPRKVIGLIDRALTQRLNFHYS